MNEVQVSELSPIQGFNAKVYGTWDNPMFLAKDVSELLEIKQASVMIRNVDDDEKVVNSIHTLGGYQDMWFLTEDGLYEVLMTSRKPIAKQFKKQVKSMLKSVRKTGSYQIQPQYNIPQTLPEALRLSADLAEQNAELKLKAVLHDKFIATGGAINLTAASKELNVKRRELVDKLLNQGYIYRTKDHRGTIQPMKKYVPKLFVLKSGGTDPDGFEFTPQMLITPYGREFIYKKFYAPDQLELSAGGE